MSIGNVNNNSAAQLQFYAQEKNAISTKAEQTTQTPATALASGSDSVQISDRARLLLAQNSASTTLGNGGGIIPPGNAPTTEGSAATVQGNGGGIIPPANAPITGGDAVSTQGNGGGIIPPGNAPITGGDAVSIQGNGGGIIPPGN